MLNLQAQTLEQQERLYKNQVRLKIREILQEELSFYQEALATISNTAALLGGFALTSIEVMPFYIDPKFNIPEALYYFFALASTGVCCLTVVAAQFAALFSMRVALRGGETSVEDTIVKIRGEYQLVLFMLVFGVELFIVCIPFLLICKLNVANSILVSVLTAPSVYLVIYFYQRSKEKFMLKDDEKFMSSNDNGSGSSNKKGKKGLKNMNYLKDIDKRNEDRRVPKYTNRKKKNDKKKDSRKKDSSSSKSSSSKSSSPKSSSPKGGPIKSPLQYDNNNGDIESQMSQNQRRNSGKMNSIRSILKPSQTQINETNKINKMNNINTDSNPFGNYQNNQNNGMTSGGGGGGGQGYRTVIQSPTSGGGRLTSRVRARSRSEGNLSDMMMATHQIQDNYYSNSNPSSQQYMQSSSQMSQQPAYGPSLMPASPIYLAPAEKINDKEMKQNEKYYPKVNNTTSSSTSFFGGLKSKFSSFSSFGDDSDQRKKQNKLDATL